MLSFFSEFIQEDCSLNVNDDIDKGFVVGSRWILDNGDTYICTNNTNAAATWSLLTTNTGFEQNFLLMGG